MFCRKTQGLPGLSARPGLGPPQRKGGRLWAQLRGTGRGARPTHLCLPRRLHHTRPFACRPVSPHRGAFLYFSQGCHKAITSPSAATLSLAPDLA